MMELLNVLNLNKTYPDFSLKNVSFSLQKGEIAGFIGRNGAGKTTTIKSILGLVKSDSGDISYFGKPLKANETEIKNRTGYLTGTVSYYTKKKIKDIVDVTKIFYENWDESTYKKYLELFGIDENKTPSQLSEGMKIKLNLLIALSHKAEILILDEPTSGLDPFSRDELLEIFLKLKKEGVAILFSTHIISDIEKCADKIIYISKGEIKAESAKAEFLKNLGETGETLEETFLRLERGAL